MISIADAIDYSIENGILAEFLQKNRDEVMVMLCAEYSLEDYKADMEQYVQELKEQVNQQEEQLADKDNQLVEKDKEIARLRELLKKQIITNYKLTYFHDSTAQKSSA